MMLSACIEDSSPGDDLIELQSGQSQIFAADSTDPQAAFDCYLDEDGDGYGDANKMQMTATPLANCVDDRRDCDDADASIYPNAIETCNGKDDNCDGRVDENLLNTYYQDTDGDGYGAPGQSIESCSLPDGYVSDDSDCNDDSAEINPGASEIQCDNVDNDCSGSDLCQASQDTYFQDADGDGFGNPAISAIGRLDGFVPDSSDCDDTNSSIHPGAREQCNHLDDNCDGIIDEGLRRIFFLDGDNDGFGTPGQSMQACSTPAGYVTDSTDCNDAAGSVHPGAAEQCNGIDDNCNGQIDEGLTPASYYRDADSDGYGSPDLVKQACRKPDGYVADGSDCNDGRAEINPGAQELCNQIDDNCNGQIDEGAQALTYFRDADGDGYGDSVQNATSCIKPSGYVLKGGDCNDADVKINPAATEICNGVDDNCDEVVDEGARISYYRDADGDGHGNESDVVLACAAPEGYVSSKADCDDTDAAVNPAAEEVCNNTDDDCNGIIDDDLALVTYYEDHDGDGFGNPKRSGKACTAPAGWVADGSDCDDTLAAVNPAAAEICNDIDDNCDGAVDEGALQAFFEDADGDGHGNGEVHVTACEAPAGYVEVASDCDDAVATTYPGAEEICNGIDDNCNSQVDEGVQSAYYPDADNDGYGSSVQNVQACTAPENHVTTNTDCDDANAAVNPGVAETCNGIDDNCDGIVDNKEEGKGCQVVPAVPQNMSASDIGSGSTAITVTWNASEKADYYVVYRSAWEENGTYQKVAEKVTGTSFKYTQNWQDVYSAMGPIPTLLFSVDSTAADRIAFINTLDAYMAKAYPLMADFKAPAFFKVQACNELGCSDMSAADAGRAEYIHTASFSEIAEIFIPAFHYPMIRSLATTATGADSIYWCGADLCGTGGGIVMARFDLTSVFSGVMPQIDMYYENYTGSMGKNKTIFTIDGYLGGMQSQENAFAGIFTVSGDFDFQLPGGIFAQVFAWVQADATSSRNQGYVTVTYHNNSYQFKLPIQPTNGETVGTGPKVTPVQTAHDDLIMDVEKRDTTYPAPLTEPMDSICKGVTTGVTTQDCKRISY